MLSLEERLANLARGKAARRAQGENERAGQVYWRGQLGVVPSWALEAELERRGDAPQTDQTVRLPGLVIDPVGGTITWRGDEYVVGGRQMEVLYCLALARRAGHRRLRHSALGPRVWRGFAFREARQNVRVYVTYLNQRFPGLLDREKVGLETAVGLVLDEPTVQAEGVA